MPIPKPERLEKHYPELAQLVEKTSWLPNPNVVAGIKQPAFPTSRYKADKPRFSPIEENHNVVGMYDDNATPQWAIFWSHDLNGTRPKGWTIAHVWPPPNDRTAYTHLANLLMVPETLASLTDKNGPLSGFLRFHAWNIYS